jgi:hypothetical protein
MASTVEAMDPGLRTKYDLHITVEANEYPERRRNLKDEWEEICDETKALLKSLEVHEVPGWIWIKLFPAVWGEI